MSTAGRMLVTGASGFIGRRCLPLLAARGFEVHAASRSVGRPSHDTGPVEWHACDLLAAGTGEALASRLRPTHLLHLAWIAQPGVFWTSPENERWLTAGRALLAAFYANGGEHAVVSGSCAEYARSDVPCIEDETPIEPATPYGRSKAALHLALREAAGGRSWAWARLFFPYGPGEAPGRFIPSVIEALRQRRPLACSHGMQVRDFIHVDDVAEALAVLASGASTGTYNIGTGRGLTLREAAAVIVSQLGGGELLRFGERQAPEHDDPCIVANRGKMARELGWTARLSLDAGVRRTLAALDTAMDGAP